MKQRATRAITAAMIALFAAHCAGEAHYHLRTDGRRVRTGLERFIASKAKKYRGKSAALVTNHSGYDFDLKQNIQLLRDKGIKISMVFAPEHGVYGYMDDIDRRGWWYDGTIRCTVYNLYGINRAFLRYLLGLSDIVIFDIQDMGMRCYTYITNLKDVIDALDGLGRELIVLDRPNPVGFIGIDGSNLEPRFTTKYVSAFPAPFLYGMTIGEAARYYCGRFRPNVKLTVIRMRGYSRKSMFHRTRLPWIPPSPNLPTYESSIVYTAIVLLEGINLSLGRGTTKPFEYIGAPWIEPVAFSAMLNALGLETFRFKPVYFKPTFSKYKGMRCGGAQIFYTGGAFSPTETAFRIIGAIRKRYPWYFQWVRYGQFYDVDALAGTDKFRVFIQTGRPWNEFVQAIKPGIKDYKKKRRKYLLY